jgi:hypothetical protein
MLNQLNNHYPVRYTVLGLCAFGLALALFSLVAFGVGWLALLCFRAAGTGGVRHAPVAPPAQLPGHRAPALPAGVHPPRDPPVLHRKRQRGGAVLAPAALAGLPARQGRPDKRPFGTQLDVAQQGYEWINHSLQPTGWRRTISASGPSATSGCTQPYDASVFNISAMSFGALSANAILALNAGAKKGGFAHDTGEGSISNTTACTAAT